MATSAPLNWSTVILNWPVKNGWHLYEGLRERPLRVVVLQHNFSLNHLERTEDEACRIPSLTRPVRRRRERKRENKWGSVREVGGYPSVIISQEGSAGESRASLLSDVTKTKQDNKTSSEKLHSLGWRKRVMERRGRERVEQGQINEGGGGKKKKAWTNNNKSKCE